VLRLETGGISHGTLALAGDVGRTDKAIAANVSVSLATVDRTKRCLVVDSLEAAMIEAPRPGARAHSVGQAAGAAGGRGVRQPPGQPAVGFGLARLKTRPQLVSTRSIDLLDEHARPSLMTCQKLWIFL